MLNEGIEASMQTFLDRIIKWGEQEEAVKALILQGSRAAGIADEYSDYDLAVFCSTYEPYIQEESWLSNIKDVWVCVHEKVVQNDKVFPTRLVIFEGGIKADFTFYTMDVLEALGHKKSLPDEYNRGYLVLLDKESLAASLPKASGKERPANKPSEQEFLRVIKEFWFEVHHVAKYLKREDLWSAKFRSGSINDHFLLKMIQWHEEARLQWQSRMPPLGKRMHSWVDEDTWKALHQIFAHFDSKDSWQALMHTMELFRNIAIATSNKLGYNYPHDLDKHITHIIMQLA